MVDLEHLFCRCDILSLHTAFTPETFQIPSRQRLASMRSGDTLINTGRGALVDEATLVEELSSGRLRAGLDVFETEPLPADHPLLRLDNAVLLPHLGSATFLRWMVMVTRALENLQAGMSGKPLPFLREPGGLRAQRVGASGSTRSALAMPGSSLRRTVSRSGWFWFSTT